MATKTFSSRADEAALTFADALTRKKYGLSYGQYCGTVLLEAIQSSGQMPSLPGLGVDEERRRAASFIRGFSSRSKNSDVGMMSDDEIRDLMASRYE